MRTSLLSVVATSTAAVVVTSTVIVVAHVATSTSSMNVSTSHSTAIAIVVHHTSSWFWFLSWIITAAIDILLQFIGFLVLLWINWIIRLSQFLITVGEVTLVSKCTMHMGFIMSTSFSFIFIIHLWGQLFFVAHLSIQINWVLWHTTMCVHLSLRLSEVIPTFHNSLDLQIIDHHPCCFHASAVALAAFRSSCWNQIMADWEYFDSDRAFIAADSFDLTYRFNYSFLFKKVLIKIAKLSYQ